MVINELVRAFASQVRFSGLLLSMMTEKNILNREQARALIENVRNSLPKDHGFRSIYDELLREFQ